MKVTTPILIKDEKHIGREVLRALKFFKQQLRRGISCEDAANQVENAYGKRVNFYFLLALQKGLSKK